ncbi:MAG TPA: hypothetical protein VGR79_05905 [Stellaceae bacterium]|nr:hypothetical protein [Stellaceae bacterium]
MTRRRIVVLTGAGISQESGLDTFRDPDGVRFTATLADIEKRTVLQAAE